jgi:WD repeat-containing protein 35
MLAQRQLYRGDIEGAMRSALRLREYEDVLEGEGVYSLVALVALHNRHYGQASRAFIKLEDLGGGAYADLAYELFAS